MGIFDSKPNLNSQKYDQTSGDTLCLGGNNCVCGIGTISSNSGYKISGVTILNTGIQLNTILVGCNTEGSGASTAVGTAAKAIGISSVAIGCASCSYGNSSVAIGSESVSLCNCSVSIGFTNISCGLGSGILGGYCNYICTGNTNTVLIGGNNITLAGSAYSDYVVIPNLAIYCTPSGSGNILCWNSTSKKVGLTNVSGGTGLPGGSINTIQYNDNGSFGGLEYVVNNYGTIHFLDVGDSGLINGPLITSSSETLNDNVWNIAGNSTGNPDNHPILEFVIYSGFTGTPVTYSPLILKHDGIKMPLLPTKTTETCGVYIDSSGNLSTGLISGGTPAGNNTEIQYNDNGSFGASTNFTYNQFYNSLTLGNNRTGNIGVDTIVLTSTIPESFPNEVSGTGSVVFGDNIISSGNTSFIYGGGIWSCAQNNILFGVGLQSNIYSEIIFGQWNVIGSGCKTLWCGGDNLFTIANGTVGGRSNALQIKKNGNLYLPHITGCTNSNILYYDSTDGSVSYGVAPSGGTGSIPAGNNTEVQYNDNGSFGASSNFKYNGESLFLRDANVNTFIGGGGNITSGSCNAGFGINTFVSLSTGCNNVAVGQGSQQLMVNGCNNTTIGFSSFGGSLTGKYNIGVGYKAGAYETGNCKLYIDSIDRATELNGKTNSLMYGEFNATPSNQLLRINGQLKFPYLTGCTNSNVLYYNSVDGTVSYGTNSSVPTGSDGAIQYKDGTVFGGTGLIWDDSVNTFKWGPSAADVYTNFTINSCGGACGAEGGYMNADFFKLKDCTGYYDLIKLSEISGDGVISTSVVQGWQYDASCPLKLCGTKICIYPPLNLVETTLPSGIQGDTVRTSSGMSTYMNGYWRDTIGKKDISVIIFASNETAIIGDGTLPVFISQELTGYKLHDVLVGTTTAATGGTTTDVQLRRVRSGSGVDMLSTKVTLSNGEYFANDGVINATYRTLAKGDTIFVDVDAVGNGTKGLYVTLTLIY